MKIAILWSENEMASSSVIFPEYYIELVFRWYPIFIFQFSHNYEFFLSAVNCLSFQVFIINYVLTRRSHTPLNNLELGISFLPNLSVLFSLHLLLCVFSVIILSSLFYYI